MKVLDFVQLGARLRSSDVFKVVDFKVSASADMTIFSDVFPS